MSLPAEQERKKPDPRVVAALCGAEAARDRALALRTRRSVYNALAARRSDRAGERRSLILALLLTGALALALAPAVWAGIDGVLGSDSILDLSGDLPGLLAAFGASVIAALAAALFFIGENRRSPEHARDGRR